MADLTSQVHPEAIARAMARFVPQTQSNPQPTPAGMYQTWTDWENHQRDLWHAMQNAANSTPNPNYSRGHAYDIFNQWQQLPPTWSLSERLQLPNLMDQTKRSGYKANDPMPPVIQPDDLGVADPNSGALKAAIEAIALERAGLNNDVHVTPRPAIPPTDPFALSSRDWTSTGRTSFDTPLTPQQEQAFQAWKRLVAPNDSGADYDLRGAFVSGLKPDLTTGHWSDLYKKPNEPTFSDQSIYARDEPALVGHWNGDTYTGPQSKGTSRARLDMFLRMLSPAIGRRLGRQAI